MTVNKVLIITPSIKKESKSVSKEIEDFLISKNIICSTVFIDSTDEKLVLDKDVDLIIALGGDGTVLYCARAAMKNQVTVLPINLGSFGYITEIEKTEWKEAYMRYVEKNDNVSKRLMINVEVYRKSKKVFSSVGLNEAVICSSGIAKVINLSLSIDKTFAGNFRADGMIVATPTGSTGYSLASGGPILDAEMNAMIITPICPFALSNRPLVTGEKEILLTVKPNQRTDIVLTVDGQVFFELEEEDEIIVRMNSKRLKLIRSSMRNFTEVVRDKLNWTGEMRRHD